MSPCKDLHDLLTNHIIKDANSVMQQMNEYSSNNELTEDMKDEHNNLQAMIDHFLEIQSAIENQEIDPKNCEELLKEFNTMRQMGA
jgi:wobble nucleotide-excising tRNase